MITLDDFVENEKIRIFEKGKKKIEKQVKAQSKIRSITGSEVTEKDLPPEIRKDPKKFIETVKKQNLSKNQKALVEMIEKGFKIKLKNKQVIEVEPYMEFYLLLLYKSLNTKK